ETLACRYVALLLGFESLHFRPHRMIVGDIVKHIRKRQGLLGRQLKHAPVKVHALGNGDHAPAVTMFEGIEVCAFEYSFMSVVSQVAELVAKDAGAGA